MARFSGLIGYAVQVEKAPGVWDDQITEHPYRGDVLRSQRSLQNDTENLHQRLNVGVFSTSVIDRVDVSVYHIRTPRS